MRAARPSRSARFDGPLVGPAGLAAVGALFYLWAAPSSADLMAQLYRAELASDGTWLWSDAWFSGHLLPSYSVLSPGLGALLGVRVLGAVAVLAATVAFARLIAETRPAAGPLPATWFALAAVAALWTGRITFLLGVAIGLATLVAWARGRRWLALGGGVLTAAASPVAGLFLALVVVAWGLAERDRRRVGAGLAVAALGPIVLLNAAFGEGGTFPFVSSAFWPALAATVLVGIVAPRQARAVRVGAALYLVLLVAAFVLPTAVGGNATRLGGLFAGPVVAAVLVGRRPIMLSLVAVPLLWWALYPPTADWMRARGDRALEAAYYVPLIEQVRGRTGTDVENPHRTVTTPPRIEVVPTANKGEAYYLARRIPIARGWERQLDRKLGALFYADLRTPERSPGGPVIDADTYRAWLTARDITWVALPRRTAIDPASQSEAHLLRRPPSWLREVWRSPDWVLFAVQPSGPRSQGALPYSVTAGGVVRTSATTGRTGRLSLRHHRWWSVAAGAACVTATDDGFLALAPRRTGRIELRSGLAGPTCQ